MYCFPYGGPWHGQVSEGPEGTESLKHTARGLLLASLPASTFHETLWSKRLNVEVDGPELD